MKHGLTRYQANKMKDNLYALFAEATEDQLYRGRVWYRSANAWCEVVANKYGLNPRTVAGVVSALSPNNKWERNLTDAKAVIVAYKAGLGPDSVKVCTYNTNKQKAFDTLKHGVDQVFTWDKSPKTFSFVRNVGDLDPSYVTIDMWHWRAVTLGMKSAKPKSLTNLRYKQIEGLTKEVAIEVGLPAHELQAVVWNVIREK